jgi:hypothetical protein
VHRPFLLDVHRPFLLDVHRPFLLDVHRPFLLDVHQLLLLNLHPHRIVGMLTHVQQLGLRVPRADHIPMRPVDVAVINTGHGLHATFACASGLASGRDDGHANAREPDF